MDFEGARRVMETTSFETANQYLRFGWKLVNQYVIAATDERPAMMNYVLGSFRSLEDTREVITLEDTAVVNQHLSLGWKLIDEYVSQSPDESRRQESIQFVLAWQREEDPVKPGQTPQAPTRDDDAEIELGGPL